MPPVRKYPTTPATLFSFLLLLQTGPNNEAKSKPKWVESIQGDNERTTRPETVAKDELYKMVLDRV